jgi:hypothetical protein
MMLSLRVNLVSFRFHPNRRRGGIGRRAGLKIQWPQGRVGSSPSAGRLSMTDLRENSREEKRLRSSVRLAVYACMEEREPQC